MDKEFFDKLVKIKKHREKMREERENPFSFPKIKRIFAQTIGMNLVSVQPMSPPKGIIYF